jgi:hypothetical protein
MLSPEEEELHSGKRGDTYLTHHKPGTPVVSNMVEMSWKSMLPHEGVFLTFGEEARKASERLGDAPGNTTP